MDQMPSSPRLRLRAGLLVSLFLAAAQAPGLVAGRQAPARVDASREAIRLNNLGVASMNQQRFEEALERFTAAEAADASLAQAKENRAVALAALQRYDEAEAILEALVEADPSSARAWYNLGLLHKTLGGADASLAAFQRAAELRPSDPYAHYFVGLMASQQGRYDTAIPAFQRALEIDPFLISAEFGLARAHQRSGDTEAARRHMARFSRITQEKIASAMSLAYGDQGPMSLAAAVQPAGGPAPAAIPVTFAVNAEALAPEQTAAMGPMGGPGMCLIDGDGDGRVDVLRLDTIATTLLQNTAQGFQPRARFAAATTCAAGDLDNDERPDLVLATRDGLQLLRNAGDWTFAPMTESGVTTPDAPLLLGLALVDIDHDADLDLFVAATSRPPGADGAATVAPAHAVLFRNNGNGTFTDVTAERGLGHPNAVAIAAGDLNNDRAIDLVYTGETTAVYFNPRDGAFSAAGAFEPAAPADTLGVVILDFDKDGWMDLAFTHAGEPAVSLWRNDEGRRFARVELPAIAATQGAGLAALDYDNDGWVDLAFAGTRPGDGPQGQAVVHVLRNAGGTFENATAAVSLGDVAARQPRALVAGDLDGDFDADLVLTDPFGPPLLLRNDGGNANRAVVIALAGLNDNRSGYGTKVEVQAGTVWQKFETTAASGFLGQSAPAVLAGIGRAEQVDVVRLLWPTGVVQDEVELAANERHVISQLDRRGSSCPVLFSWNGERYEFIADAIGPAVIGHWVAPGRRNIPDVDELVKVEGRHVRVKDGRLSFRFAEPMEEVIYLDQVKLFAIDHPEGTEVHPNEYFAALPPHPEDRAIASRGARLVAGAWDQQGRDLMPALAARDRRFAETFESDVFKGFAKPHAIELDLGERPAGAPVRLLMHGFTDYFTANSVFAAHQADISPVVPWVEAQLPDGSWRRIADDIGFPAGLLRTMVADLTGKLPDEARRIRIWTNLKIYWDEIRVDTTPDGAVPVTRTEIPLAEASLAFRGFPREVTGTPAADLQYVHADVSPFGPYARHRGFYTKYGDVMPLLLEAEDRFVIFGAGDEVALEFDAAALPPLPEGWTRDYFMYFNGYVKDMDFYAAHAQTVAPLPFKGMPGYPYPDAVRYPDRHLEYLLEWNTREVAAEGWPSYRFEHERTR
jgi:Tfp pilus assembly protein PilF